MLLNITMEQRKLTNPRYFIYVQCFFALVSKYASGMGRAQRKWKHFWKCFRHKEQSCHETLESSERINVWTKSKKWLTIPNKDVRLRKLNRPHNCLTYNISESVDIKKEGILQVFFFFNPVKEYNADIILEDKDRYCERAIKSNRLLSLGSA